VLIGRSPLEASPEDHEDSELQLAHDANALRALLATRMNGAGRSGPAAVEAQCRRILTQREIRATLAAIREAGGRAEYVALDVRDAEALTALLDRLQAAHGRIDGVIHGAGLIDDKLVIHKRRDSFERVFETKVHAAHILAERLAANCQFFVLFSSVASVFGSRGQSDYCAANDALDKLAHSLHGQVSGKVLAINWGPWREVGMVRPELEREYARRGIELITPEHGVESFFEALLGGAEPQVIITASSAAFTQPLAAPAPNVSPSNGALQQAQAGGAE
jgi:NAD(P)-dependent dehydrogenase (short-subunit alcohol dehydrogenase family)